MPLPGALPSGSCWHWHWQEPHRPANWCPWTLVRWSCQCRRFTQAGLSCAGECQSHPTAAGRVAAPVTFSRCGWCCRDNVDHRLGSRSYPWILSRPPRWPMCSICTEPYRPNVGRLESMAMEMPRGSIASTLAEARLAIAPVGGRASLKNPSRPYTPADNSRRLLTSCAPLLRGIDAIRHASQWSALWRTASP